jgi:hypothetical protein
MMKMRIALALILICAVSVAAQKRNWLEWSKKDAERILNDSAWGQTQTETDTSEMTFSPTTPTGANAAARSSRGALNQAVSINYRIRFLSAKPVRQAFARLILMQQEEHRAQLLPALESFVERDFSEYIVVAVTFDSTDQRFSTAAMQSFNAATTQTLKNATYLERKDGKRLFLAEYRTPIADGLGAKFVFQRKPDGQAFLDEKSGEVRFVCEMSKNIKLNRRFKISEMIYNGKLEL